MEEEQAGLPEELRAELRALLAARGLTRLTAVQLRSLRPVLQGCDLSVCAPTGSGKTLAYALPLAHAHAAAEAAISLLVLLPTRELAAQVHGVLAWLAPAVGATTLLCAGGSPLAPQEEALRPAAPAVHWVVGTPGRLRDLAARGLLRLGSLRCRVLDEADRLVDEGLQEDVRALLRLCPPPSQALWLSATWSSELARQLQAHDEAAGRPPSRRRVHVSVAGQGGLRGGVGGAVQHLALLCPSEQQAGTAAGAIKLLLAEAGGGGGAALVFCTTRDSADATSLELQRLGLRCAVLHGALPQAERNAALELLRAGGVDALAATDVAARGLDCAGVELVVHCGLPTGGGEAYAHRAGRAGRPGCRVAGVSLLLYCPDEAALLTELQRTSHTALLRITQLAELSSAPQPAGLAAPTRTPAQQQAAFRASNALLAGARLASMQADLASLGVGRKAAAGGGRRRKV